MDEPVTVAGELITVEKSIVDLDSPRLMGVQFTITSNATVPVIFGVVDELPDSVSVEDIGLHPEYRGAGWTRLADQDRLVFIDRIQPGEPMETVWGIQSHSRRDIVRFLTKPTIEGCVPDASIDQRTGWSEEAKSRRHGRLDTAVQTEEVQPDRRKPSREKDPSDTTTGMVTHLVEEIRSGEVTDEELAELREVFGVETPHQLWVQTRQLESHVVALTQYTSNLEALFEEPGLLGSDVTRIRDRLTDVATRLDTLAHYSAVTKDRDEMLIDRLNEVESTIDDIEEIATDIDGLRLRLQEHHEQREETLLTMIDAVEADIREDIETVWKDVESLEEDIHELGKWRLRVLEAVRDAGDTSDS